jgi:hypothetical protein
VVLVGDTEVFPPLAGVTVPTPPLIEQEVALVEVQLSVELLPDSILVGLAASVAVGTG